VASVPLQPPEAAQESALREDHVSVEVPPVAIAVGSAASVTVGGFTLIVTVAGALLPPGPAHVIEKVAFPVNTPLLCEPLAPSVPLQPAEAVHDVALLEAQVSITELPTSTVVCEAVSDAVGMAAGGWEPPPQAQSSAAALPTNSENTERTTSQG
jgi:hypothetical protein